MVWVKLGQFITLSVCHYISVLRMGTGRLVSELGMRGFPRRVALRQPRPRLDGERFLRGLWSELGPGGEAAISHRTSISPYHFGSLTAYGGAFSAFGPGRDQLLRPAWRQVLATARPAALLSVGLRRAGAQRPGSLRSHARSGVRVDAEGAGGERGAKKVADKRGCFLTKRGPIVEVALEFS